MNNDQLLSKIHLVVDKLLNLGGADYDSDKAASDEARKKGLIARDFGIEEWDWPQGVGLYGLLKLQEFYKDERYLDYLKNWYDSNLQKGLPSRNINTTTPYLTLASLLDVLNNPEYEELCIRQAQWLMTEMPRTAEGGFQHVTSAIGDRNGINRNDGEMWIDTLFMAVLFLNKMGQRCGRQDWISESIHQILIHIKYLYEKKNGLFYHGWSFLQNSNFGGIFWCRGNSWFTFGMMDYLEASQNSLDPGLRSFLEDTFKAQAKTLKELQAPSGLWHTVLTDPASYEEVSGSAAIAAGILKGLKLKILDNSYELCAQKAIEAICLNIGDDGTVEHVSAGTGMGYDSRHYKDIAIMPMAYGQSLALAALCEALT